MTSKPLLIFDVDGVILNFSKGFADYFNAKHSHIELPHNPHEWDYGLTGDDLALMKSNIKSFIDEGHQLDLLHDDMPDVVNDSHDNFDVQIVTSFHNHSSRILNLEKFAVRYNKITFSDNINKVDIIKSLNPQFVVEGCPRHVEGIHNSLPNTVIFVPEMWEYTKPISGERVVKYRDPEHLRSLIHEYK